MKYRSIALTAAVSMVLLLAAGCSSGKNVSDKKENTGTDEKITVEIGEQNDYLFSYAVKTGIADEVLKGTNVEYHLTFYASGPNMNDAYSADAIDFATMGSQPALSGAASGRGYHIFARFYGQESNSPLIASKDSGIEKIEDLKGKNVGTYVGGTWQYYLSKYLEKAGLTEEDVNLFNTAAETATAIRSGEIDAAVIGLSTAYILEEEGSAHIVSNEPGTDSANAITVRDRFVEEHPEEAKLIAEIYRRTVEKIAENPDEWSELVAEKQEVDAETVKKANRLNTYAFELSDEDIRNLSELYDFMVEKELVVDNGAEFDGLFNRDLAK